MASEATVYIQLEDVNDEIPLFTEREQETVLEGEPIGTKVTQVNAIDRDGTFPNNHVIFFTLLRKLYEISNIFPFCSAIDRFIIMSSTHPETKAKISSKSTSRAVKYSQKLYSIVKSKAHMHLKLKLEMEHHRLVPIAIINQIQVCKFSFKFSHINRKSCSNCLLSFLFI